ncbi:MAG: winged helix-turn-helix transcriptional regulator [Halobacteriales archaeon]
MIDETGEEAEFEAEARKAALFQLLGSAHTLAILREFAAKPGPQRFSDLQDELGISPTTLSDRLEELCEAGIIDRESHDEIPPRVEYRPTEKGQALRPILEAVADWIDEHEA